MTNTNIYNSKYKNFYVLGDSLSDNGALIGILNNLSFVKCVKFDKPFYQGRSFTNGPTAVEYVAQYLGLKDFKPGWSYKLFSKQYEQQGQNYAVSYATACELTDPIYSYFFNKFCLANQLSTVIKHHPDIGEEDLFLIMIGGNDIMLAYTYHNADKAEKVLKNAIREICNALEILSKHGVKHVVVADVPDIGLIPAFNKSEETRKLATKLTENFNVKLANSLKDIQYKYTNLEIKRLDLDSKVKGIINEYKNNSLNYRDPCISNVADTRGFISSVKVLFRLIFKGKMKSYYNPECSERTLKDYLFFDSFHPTKGLHEQLGNEIYNLIVK